MGSGEEMIINLSFVAEGVDIKHQARNQRRMEHENFTYCTWDPCNHIQCVRWRMMETMYYIQTILAVIAGNAFYDIFVSMLLSRWGV